jgi:hypothetical protein
VVRHRHKRAGTFGHSGTGIGVRLLQARLRLRRLRTDKPSSRYSPSSLMWFMMHPLRSSMTPTRR